MSAKPRSVLQQARARHAKRNGEATPSAQSCRTTDDIGNAYRFADQHRPKACYVSEWGWMFFDGKRWVRDTIGQVMQFAKSTAASIWSEAEAAADKKEAQKLASWAWRSRSYGRLSAMLALAQCELPARPEEFDHDPLTLNVQNGTLNLKNLQLRPHSPADRLTRLCNAKYLAEATAPQWQATLTRFLPEELAAFLQRSFGLAISGQTEKAFWLLFGPSGDNGKSTTTAAIAYVLGDYAAHVKVDVLTARHRSPGDEDQLAALAGARFVVSSEVDARQFNARLVKDLTGEMDTIRTKFMGQRTFEYRPRFKLFVYGNRKPRLDATDQALWNRVLCVPFDRTIAKEERLPNFCECLQGEADGILRWLVDGFETYRERGLRPPSAVLDATAGYRNEMDVLGDFIKENCTLDKDSWVKFSTFKEQFENFTGQKAPHDLGSQLVGKGFARDKHRLDGRIYRGLRFTHEGEV